jgi:major membrane immunogen (membrane-anchored lipoprotein)
MFELRFQPHQKTGDCCMKEFRCFCLLVLFASSAFATVTVTAPSKGATSGSPVHFAATATTTCSKGVSAMGIYTAPYKLDYVVNGASLNTNLTMSPGTYNTVIEEWDGCGGATTAPVTITVTGGTGVFVTSPSNNSQVGSPVNFVATATTTCSKGVSAMGIYTAPYQLAYIGNGSSLNTNLTLSAGTYNTVVEEWDGCGGAAVTPVTITVTGSGGNGQTFSNLQASSGWTGYGQLPPYYQDCSSCGSSVTWSTSQGISSPSLDGKAMQFNIGGNLPYSDVLWNNHLIGDFSSQGLPDTAHTLVPTLSNFTYDVYFYGANLQTAQALEFDINQFFNNLGFTWGHECRTGGGNEWDIWDNVNMKWLPTGIACNPTSNSWNHLIIQVQRTSDNQLLYQSITLNGVKNTLNLYYAPFSAPGWYGVTVNYQLDGNSSQQAYTTFLDEFNFTYY